MDCFSSSASPVRDLYKGKEPAIEYSDDDDDVPYRPHVLVVDENPIVRKAHKSLFEKRSCFVSAVEKVSHAMELLGIGDGDDFDGLKIIDTVDLVCTNDCMLPDMSGYELLMRMKESPTTKDVPVVIVSTSDQDRINECMEAGAVDFILKPLKSADVKSLVKLVTENRRR